MNTPRLYRKSWADAQGVKRTADRYTVELRVQGRVRRLVLTSDARRSRALADRILHLIADAEAGIALDAGVVKWVDALPPKMRAALIEWGVIEPQRHAAGRTIADDLDDYRGHLEHKRNSHRHVADSIREIEHLAEVCGWQRVKDIRPGPLVLHLTTLDKAGRSPRRINAVRAAAFGFCAWLVRAGRLGENPIVRVPVQREAGDQRRLRRSMTDAEIVQLVTVTERGPERFHMTGKARAMLYTVAVNTGLRAAELFSIRPEDFDVAGDSPSVTVAAAYTKNREAAQQPIPRDVADVLRPWIATLPQDRRVWVPTKHTGKMIKADLDVARAAYIAAAPTPAERQRREESTFCQYHDGERYIDFHGLRHTYVSRLCRAGISPKAAQALARHSTIRLTMDRYTHLAIDEAARALEKLPRLMPDAGNNTTFRTGTEG